MVRQGEIEDFSQLMVLFKEAYENTPFGEMEYNEAHVFRTYSVACEFRDKFFCRVVEESGQLVGVLIGYLDRNVWGVPIAQSMVSYSRKDTHILIRQFVEWSELGGAEMVTVTTVPGKGRYEELVKKIGFVESGNMYTLEI